MAVKLTAGNLSGAAYGYARVGSSIFSTFGSMSAEPFSGFVVDYWVTDPGGTAYDVMALVGNTVATFTRTSVMSNGISWTINQPGEYNSETNTTSYTMTVSTPKFADGQSYSISISGDTGIPADHLLRVTPETVEGPSISPALPTAVGGKRTIANVRNQVALTSPVYMAVRIATISGVWWPFASFSTADPSTFTGASSGIAASTFLSDNITGFMEDDTLGNRSSPTGHVATPGEIVVIEAWKDVGTGHWRVSVNNTDSTEIAISTTPVNYSWLAFNLYEISGPVFDLYDTVVYNRVPTTTERTNIRASMAAQPPVITSSPTVYVKEGQPIDFFVTATKPRADLSVTGGADASKITTAGAELVWENGLPRSYDSPDDAGGNGVYNIEITWTDLDGLTAVQNLTVTLQRKPVFTKDLWGQLDCIVSSVDPAWDDGLSGVLLAQDYFKTPEPSSGVTANANITEAADTLTSTGAIRTTGAAAITIADDTVSSAAKVAIVGQANNNIADDTVTATFSVATPGAVADANITEASDTLSSTALVAVKATVAFTLDDTVSADTLVRVQANANLTLVDDAMVSTTTAVVQGTTNLTLADDTATSTATIRIRADASVTLADDTVNASIGAPLALLNADITEASDTIVSAGTVRITGSATAQLDDTLSSDTRIQIRAASSPTEADDTMVSSTNIRLTAVALVTEADDFISSTGHLTAYANATLAEANDTVTSTGVTFIRAAANITEANDTATSTTTAPLFASGALNEANDTLTTVVRVANPANANITEADDTVTSAAKAPITAVATFLLEDDVFAEASEKIVVNADLYEDDDEVFSHIGQPVITPPQRNIELTSPVSKTATLTVMSMHLEFAESLLKTVTFPIGSRVVEFIPGVSRSIEFGPPGLREVKL